jgi:hypothetical protein
MGRNSHGDVAMRACALKVKKYVSIFPSEFEKRLGKGRQYVIHFRNHSYKRFMKRVYRDKYVLTSFTVLTDDSMYLFRSAAIVKSGVDGEGTKFIRIKCPEEVERRELSKYRIGMWPS